MFFPKNRVYLNNLHRKSPPNGGSELSSCHHGGSTGFDSQSGTKVFTVKIIQNIHEPFNSISHGFGAFLGLFGFSLLLYLAEGLTEYVGVSLFGLSLIFLYTMSALYHGLNVSKRTRRILRLLDQIGIYLLIAGTVSPIALLVLSGWSRVTVLVLMWLFAALGSVLTLMEPFESRKIPTVIYLSMGWIPIVFANEFISAMSPEAIIWCLVGGLLYTVGAFFHMFNSPRLVPDYFGSHELWHVLTILGTGSHYILISTYTI